MGEIRSDDFIIRPCTTCGNNVKTIDMDRIKMKLDMHFGNKEFDQAERLINYWLIEAKNGNNERAELELQNEYMGFCRKQGRKDDAILHAERAVEIVNHLNLGNTIGGATVYVNVATVFKAFGDSNKALSYFKKAKAVYDVELKGNDKKLASLYNNMALALVDLNQYDAATNMYKNAIEIMNKADNGELDAAISYLNFADLLYAKYKTDASDDYSKYENDIQQNIETAWKLFNLEKTPHDDYYRFVCEKSAPTFGFYGYFMYQKKLEERSIKK